MNIAIAKVIIQGFVNDKIEYFNFIENNWPHNAKEILKIASQFGEDEIIELTKFVLEMDMGHIFSMKGVAS